VELETTGPFVATYLTRTDALPAARRELASWLRGADVPDDVGEELLVVLSELLSNAISASPDGDQEAAVSAEISDGSVTLVVTNPPESGFGAVDRYDYDDPLRPGGRGLLIVEALVDDLAVVPPSPHRSLSVRCRRDLVRPAEAG
jgi:anti-sigma regulatory factor (Ser/Thr protein kinase)